MSYSALQAQSSLFYYITSCCIDHEKVKANLPSVASLARHLKLNAVTVVLQVGSEDIDSGDDSDASEQEDSEASAAGEDAASQQDLAERQEAGNSSNDDDDDGDAAGGDDDDDAGDLSWEAVMAAMQGGGSDAEAEEEPEQQQPDDNSPQPDDVKFSLQKRASNKPKVHSVRQKGKQSVQAKASNRTSQLGKRPRQR